MRFGQPRGRFSKLVRFVAIDRFDERVAGGEMAIEGSNTEASHARNLLKAGAGAFIGESYFRRFEEMKTVALCRREVIAES